MHRIQCCQPKVGPVFHTDLGKASSAFDSTITRGYDESMTCYTIVYPSASIHQLKIYKNLSDAQAELKRLAKERQYKLGVAHWHETENSFSYIFGWEETTVTFRIVELDYVE